MGFLAWIILGLIVGAIVKAVMPGRVGGGWVTSLILGVVGAIVGGWIGSLLFAKGDMTAPNPRTSALVRAGVLREKTVFFRNDIAFADDPTVNKDPHTFLQPLTAAGVAGQVARGGQTAIADFFVSGGTTISQPLPARFFEFPIVVMPEDYSYIP